MTKKQLQQKLFSLGLSVDETKTSHALDIQIYSPPGKCFEHDWHVLVTHWYTNYPLARQQAYEDAKGMVDRGLKVCREDCSCKEDEDYAF